MLPVRPRFRSFLAALILGSLLAAGQVPGQSTSAPAPKSDNLSTLPQATQDTAVTKNASLPTPIPPGKDTMAVIAPKSRTDTVIVVKHSFNHKEQIITGSVIMSCLMLMMVAMNNYNPR